ncbi:serpin family protein [Planctomycetota bacterium]
MKAIQCISIVSVVMAAVVSCRAENEPAATSKRPAQQIVVEGNNKFALELYAKLQSEEGNLFFSPYSISTALAMTYAGARGETQKQMARVLHFPTVPNDVNYQVEKSGSEKQLLEQSEFHREFGGIIKNLNSRGRQEKYELAVANALWGQDGYEFLKEFLELLEVNYGGGLNEVGFVNDAEAARQKINSWVQQQTNEKIKDLIGKGVLDAMTRLVLTNAIYFKGSWARQFEQEQTSKAPFYPAAGKQIDVPLMHQQAKFNYAQTEDLQVLELPYVDDELSMIILLPKERGGIEKIENKLTEENLCSWLGELRNREVTVFIPKFKMTRKFMLADVLKSMGMADAFSGSADFSGMTGERDLFISAVIHKAYVDVNEEGTEAAAATAVVMRLTSVGPKIPVFRADHPFIFLIRDNLTGGILFIGRLINPKA